MDNASIELIRTAYQQWHKQMERNNKLLVFASKGEDPADPCKIALWAEWLNNIALRRWRKIEQRFKDRIREIAGRNCLIQESIGYIVVDGIRIEREIK